MTGSEAVGAVFTKLKEESANPIFWSEAEILGYVNSGYLDLCTGTGLYTEELSSLIETGDFVALADKSINRIYRVRLNTGEVLRKINPNKMNTSSNGRPKYYYVMSHDSIMFSPPTNISRTILILHSAAPAVVTGPTSFVFTDDSLLQAIIDYATGEALEKEGESLKFDRAKYYKDRYQAIKSQYTEK